ncbi:MAG: hypothetical protein B7Z55_08960 [Planctomycetales bacterium 12-60-4]|nr:MAG: hypothetical protein B7Z55_08960 [Planctomycetales bacterium 12-60-4]
MHPKRDELAAYLVGSLPEPGLSSVEAHLQTCPACETTLNLLDPRSDTMLEMLRRGPPTGMAHAESDCRVMVEVIKDIGRDPTNAGLAAASPVEAELGNLREYKLLTKIGEGGMGSVYRALHTKLEKIVALKVLPTGRNQDAAAVARFEREMKAVGKLRHPNIVGAFDAGEEHGMHFLVMELIEGESLSAIARNYAPLAVADACELVRQAAAGLQEAHEHGMVHRDIKPSNLMLTVERRKRTTIGIVKVLDMGLAILDAAQPGADDLTDSNQLMGTLNYMAPEQALGNEIDERADLFSFGAVLYEMCAGEPPFTGNTPLAVLKQITDSPARPVRALNPEIPGWLSDLIQQLLAKRPDQRPISASVVAQILAERYGVATDVYSVTSYNELRRDLLEAERWNRLHPTETPRAGFPFLGPRDSHPSGPAAVATLAGNAGPVWSVAFSPDGRQLAMGIDDGTVKMWDVDTSSLRSTISVHNGPVWTTSISSSGHLFATGHDDGTVHIWDFDAEKRLRSFKASGPVRSLAFAPQGSRLALGGRTGEVSIWDADTGEQLVTTEGHQGVVTSVAFSPDGTILGSASGDKSAKLWNAETGRARTRLDGHNGGVYSIAFSPDSKQAATGGWDRTVRLWDTGSGTPKGVLEGNEADVWSVAFSRDGSLVTAVGEDRVVRIWNLETRELLPVRRGHTGTLYASSMSTRNQLATSGRDGTVRIWDLDSKSNDKKVLP